MVLCAILTEMLKPLLPSTLNAEFALGSMTLRKTLTLRNTLTFLVASILLAVVDLTATTDVLSKKTFLFI